MHDDDSTDRPTARASPVRSPGSRSSVRVAVEWGARSNVGHIRSSNQDAFFVGRFDRTLEPVLTNLTSDTGVRWHHDAGYVAIVADGMGGHAAGDVASQTAVATFLELALDTPDWIMRYDEEALVAEVGRRTQERLQAVDRLLEAMGRRDPKLSGMGTTLTAIAMIPPHAVVAHVGDSRAYLWRLGTLSQITHDHTMGQLLADAGLIDASELSTQPESHVLTRAAGHGDGQLPVDVSRLQLEPGDQVLLCSDGLTRELSDREIEQVLAASTAPAVTANELLELALDRGGRDNITVVVGRLTAGPSA